MALSHYTATLDDLDISYYQAGDQGTPLVLLHGGGTDSAMLSWREALPALAADHVVYAPDWPGYGDSQSIANPYTLTALEQVLERLIVSLDLAKVNLVGLSMGGGAVIRYALNHPERVDKLVLVDTYGLQKQVPNHRMSYLYLHVPFMVHNTWQSLRKDKTMVRTALRGIFADPNGFTDAMVDEVYEAVQDLGSEKAFHSFRRHEVTWGGARSCFASQMQEIQAPTLFIQGDQDSLAYLATLEKVVKSMPQARLEVMDQTGHWPPREHPEMFNRMVLDFLRG